MDKLFGAIAVLAWLAMVALVVWLGVDLTALSIMKTYHLVIVLPAIFTLGAALSIMTPP